MQHYLNCLFKHFAIPLLPMDQRYLCINHHFFCTCVFPFSHSMFTCTCRVVIGYLRFGVVKYFHFQGPAIDSTRRNLLEASNLHQHSHIFCMVNSYWRFRGRLLSLSAGSSSQKRVLTLRRLMSYIYIYIYIYIWSTHS